MPAEASAPLPWMNNNWRGTAVHVRSPRASHCFSCAMFSCSCNPLFWHPQSLPLYPPHWGVNSSPFPLPHHLILLPRGCSSSSSSSSTSTSSTSSSSSGWNTSFWWWDARASGWGRVVMEPTSGCGDLLLWTTTCILPAGGDWCCCCLWQLHVHHRLSSIVTAWSMNWSHILL